MKNGSENGIAILQSNRGNGYSIPSNPTPKTIIAFSIFGYKDPNIEKAVRVQSEVRRKTLSKRVPTIKRQLSSIENKKGDSNSNLFCAKCIKFVGNIM